MAIFKTAGNSGLTLIELLIGMVILAVITTAGFQVYQAQRKAQFKQTQLIEMNQNLRAALFYLEDELKTAGCDPKGGTSNAGFVQADSATVQFTRDIAGGKSWGGGPTIVDGGKDWFDGDVADDNENIIYRLNGSDLMRDNVNSPTVPTEDVVAEGIEALDFVYLDGQNNPMPGLPVSAANLGLIRAVEVTMVARSSKPDPDFTSNTEYKNLQGDVILPAQNDHYYRRAMSITINCRNMGLGID